MTYSERLNDIAIVELDTKGFELLSPEKKKLAYHLAQAGLWGKIIGLEQNSQYNVPLLDNLIALYKETDSDSSLSVKIKNSLFILFAHSGIYHNMSGERLELPLTQADFEDVKDNNYARNIVEILFTGNKIAQFRTVQKDGVDVVASSGGNFYSGLTTEEVNKFREQNKPVSESAITPPFGFNERLVKKEDGSIECQVMKVGGLYGSYIEKIVSELRLALPYAENEKQKLSLETLIRCYETGEAKDFDIHCIAWTQDQDSDLYFVNGFIESYKDPLGIGCNFESLVAFKDPEQTAKVKKIIDNIQWFENNLPFDKRFKKEKAVGLSASSINVISMAGETAPVLPLGINLPNSDDIRKEYGSKSVTLANVDSSRNSYDEPLMKALYLPKYQAMIKQYGAETGVLHTDLHEIAGHGSGKVMEGVNTEILSKYYSVIEECRADLVALYFVPDMKLQEIGVFSQDVDVKTAALAKYVAYFTNGAIGQLRRVKMGNDLTQAHLRNRQIISTWLLEHADKDKLSMVVENGAYFIEVNDVDYVRTLVGQLLAEVQRIKSEGDFEAAKNLVETYGTKVNQLVHKEILERVKSLNLATIVGFMTPVLVEKNGVIELEKAKDFLSQQLDFYSVYR